MNNNEFKNNQTLLIVSNFIGGTDYTLAVLKYISTWGTDRTLQVLQYIDENGIADFLKDIENKKCKHSPNKKSNKTIQAGEQIRLFDFYDFDDFYKQ